MANRLLDVVTAAVRKSFQSPPPGISYDPFQDTGIVLDPYPPSRQITGGGDITSPIETFLPSTHLNYHRLAGNPFDNTLVAALLQWICRSFPLSELVVQSGAATTEEIVADHPMPALINRPNTFYTGLDLWSATLRSYNADGNAYWYKVRDGYKQVVELWYLPHWLVAPVFPKDGSIFIDHYAYTVGTETINYPVSEIVHFRNGIDPMNPRRGVSLVKTLLREIFTDNEAAQYTASLVLNGGVPGVVLTPDVQERAALPNKDQLESMKREYKARFGGDKRGDPLILSGPMKVQPISFNPKDMDLAMIRQVPEERVAAVLGVPAMVVGFGAGLARSTYNNYDTALRAAYENNILPTQAIVAATLDQQLLPDFTGADDTGAHSGFVTDHIKVLRDDENKVYERLTAAWKEGWLKRADVRRATGWETGPEDEVYMTDLITNMRETLTVKPDQPVTNTDLEAVGETADTGGNADETDDTDDQDQ